MPGRPSPRAYKWAAHGLEGETSKRGDRSGQLQDARAKRAWTTNLMLEDENEKI